jgi:hypothetical protein
MYHKTSYAMVENCPDDRKRKDIDHLEMWPWRIISQIRPEGGSATTCVDPPGGDLAPQFELLAHIRFKTTSTFKHSSRRLPLKRFNVAILDRPAGPNEI